MTGYEVAPFGPESGGPQTPGNPYTPRGRGRGGGGGGFRGRGGGRGGFNDAKSTPVGSRTPVTGLGYHGQGHKFSSEPITLNRDMLGGNGGRKRGLGDTVGKNGVTWGGGIAPLFVKAGELFKDGEVDIIKVDPGE